MLSHQALAAAAWLMPMPNRDEALAERAALIERLRGLPAAMRALPQWLVWKREQHAGEPKPRKVPYYTSGKRRIGTQGDVTDRAALATFDAALALLGKALHFTGLGFAFLPGDGLIGIDIDGAVDDDGVVSDRCTAIVQACASYTERSPSGRGVHIIVAGHTKTFKHNSIGLEVFCGSQFFTCTGAHWPGAPLEVVPIGEGALQGLRDQVEAAKGAARAAAPRAAAPGAPGAGDLTAWLEQALAVLDSNCGYNEWIGVGMALKSALGDGGQALWDYWSRKAGERYAGDRAIATHWKSFAGNDVDGALTIFKMARKGNRWKPPAEWHRVYGRPTQSAAHLTLVAPAPAGGDERPQPPPPPLEAGNSGAGAAPTRRKGGGGRKPLDGGVMRNLCDNYALIRGTDQVWDGEMRGLMQVKNLRLLFGSPYVNGWLSHPDRRVLLPEHIKFEPGRELPPPFVNLFAGLETTPVECTEQQVKPMLDLLKHLTSQSARTPEGVAAVYDQVLKWCALIVQQPGAKIRFALVFHGPQGTGKNLFWDGFRRILGRYGKMVGQAELEDRFNGYMSGKLLLIGNEVMTRQELFHGKNKLKWVITEDEIPIRGMHQEVRWESNHANVVFLSNELQPVALEKDDRRHLVVYTPAAEDPDLYLRVADFLHNDGAAKFMHYLMRIELDGFNEFTKPLMTDAKRDLIDLGLKPAERFINEWTGGLLALPLHVCEVGQLYRVFRRWCELNGEKFPPPQEQFTKAAKKHLLETAGRGADGARLEPILVYKAINLKQPEGHVKTVRCWVPRDTGPPDGVPEGDWATEAVGAFDAAARRFGRTSYEEGGP